MSEALRDLGWLAEQSFGFEALNRGVVNRVQTWAEDLRGLQTGMLSWNVAAIVIGLIAVMLIVALGA